MTLNGILAAICHYYTECVAFRLVAARSLLFATKCSPKNVDFFGNAQFMAIVAEITAKKNALTRGIPLSKAII